MHANRLISIVPMSRRILWLCTVVIGPAVCRRQRQNRFHRSGWKHAVLAVAASVLSFFETWSLRPGRKPVLDDGRNMAMSAVSPHQQQASC
jgi:hypothetical protein